MKTLTLFALTLLLTVAIGHTSATAQEWVHTATLEGHTGGVFGLAFKDDATLISGDNDNTLRAWNVITGRQSWQQDVGNFVFAIAFSSHNPDFIVYSGFDNYKIWTRSSANGDLCGEAAGHTRPVTSLAFKPNSYLLASGSWDDTIRIWNVQNHKDIRHLRTLRGHTKDVYSVAWSPDGLTLASASDDNTVRLWNPDTGKNRAVLCGHTDRVKWVTWSPDGQMLASGSNDDTIRIWDPVTQQPLRVIRNIGHSIFRSLAFSPDGKTLASSGYAGGIHLWDPTDGSRKATLKRQAIWMNSLAFSPNGQVLASGAANGSIYLWSLLIVDVTDDGVINLWDIVEVGKNYGQTVASGANQRADVNNDGKVDIDDLIVVAKAVDAASASSLGKKTCWND